MFKIEKSRTEDLRATSERKARRAFEDQDRARSEAAVKTAELRALRLAKKASDKSADNA